MALRIVIGKPPEYDRLDRLFNLSGRPGLLFTRMDVLYNPDNHYIDPALMAHEEFHSARQIAYGDFDVYLERFIEDIPFRFNEELLAHREEWRVAKAMLITRPERRARLSVIARRLSSGLYGGIVTYQQAKSIVREAGEE